MGWKLTREELKGIVKEAIEEREKQEKDNETGLLLTAKLLLAILPLACALIYLGIAIFDIYHRFGISSAGYATFVIQLVFIGIGGFFLLLDSNQKLKKKLKDKEVA